MAIPHGKNMTLDAGKQCAHWYDYLLSKRRIQRSRTWNGPRTDVKHKPPKFVVWLGVGTPGIWYPKQ